MIKEKKHKIPLTLVIIFIYASIAMAQEQVDESALFADTSSTIDSAAVVNTREAAAMAAEKKTMDFSGEVNVYAAPALSRAWFDEPGSDSMGFSSFLVGNGLLDIRLIGGAKAFADLEASYSPQPVAAPQSGQHFAIRELFVDANYKKAIYLRMGKQVLQWGRCNLWNPTDLVNMERKTFIAKMGHREGTYGLKLHIPYKTLFNFYSFIDANDASSVNGCAVAAKAEALFGRTEVAVSGWKKNGLRPVFGIDCSSQLFEVQIAAEAGIRNGMDIPTLDLSRPGINLADLGDKWIPRAAVSLTKFFPLGGLADRLMITGEFYYNHAGYDTNIFNDPRAMLLMQVIGSAGVDRRLLKIYEPNSYSKYYAMCAASISRFIIEQISFSCSALGNFRQKCFVLSSGLTYQSLNDFTAGIMINGYAGPHYTEYTFGNQGLEVRLQAGIVF